METIDINKLSKKLGPIYIWEEPVQGTLEAKIFHSGLAVAGLGPGKVILQLPELKTYPFRRGVPSSGKESVSGCCSKMMDGSYMVFMAVSPRGISDHANYRADVRYQFFQALSYPELFSHVLMHELGHIANGDFERKIPKAFKDAYNYFVEERRADNFANMHFRRALDNAGIDY